MKKVTAVLMKKKRKFPFFALNALRGVPRDPASRIPVSYRSTLKAGTVTPKPRRTCEPPCEAQVAQNLVWNKTWSKYSCFWLYFFKSPELVYQASSHNFLSMIFGIFGTFGIEIYFFWKCHNVFWSSKKKMSEKSWTFFGRKNNDRKKWKILIGKVKEYFLISPKKSIEIFIFSIIIFLYKCKYLSFNIYTWIYQLNRF